jgi:hypothetical protein
VLGRIAELDDAGADRAWDFGLRVFQAVERVEALVFDFGLVMGSSEAHATPSAAPPQPRPVNHPAGQDPEARLTRSKSPQQRSDQARKPVNSEQDSCSYAKPADSDSRQTCRRQNWIGFRQKIVSYRRLRSTTQVSATARSTASMRRDLSSSRTKCDANQPSGRRATR